MRNMKIEFTIDMEKLLRRVRTRARISRTIRRVEARVKEHRDTGRELPPWILSLEAV